MREFFPGQGKVREFRFWSGNFKILLKVREKSGNFEKAVLSVQYSTVLFLQKMNDVITESS